MRRRSGSILALVVALGAIGVAGCGEDERSTAYVAAVNAAQSDFARTFGRLRTRITETSTPSEDRRTLAEFRAVVDEAVADLEAIAPPEEVADLHGRLVGHVASYGPAIDRARAGLAGDDLPSVERAQAELAGGVRRIGARITATIRAINERLKGG